MQNAGGEMKRQLSQWRIDISQMQQGPVLMPVLLTVSVNDRGISGRWWSLLLTVQSSKNQKMHWTAVESPCSVEWWGCSMWCWEKQSSPGERRSHLNL